MRALAPDFSVLKVGKRGWGSTIDYDLDNFS